MGEPERTTDGSEDERALFEAVRKVAADPATYSEPPLADRYPKLFHDLGLRA